MSLILIAAGCGDRTLPASDAMVVDGAPAPDSAVRRDTRCVRPANGCFSSSDCPTGQRCEGCGGDPCCLTCTVCYGKCVPDKTKPATCTATKDCKKNEYCLLTSCGTGVPGVCTPRPGPCPPSCPGACGCDGKDYCSACDAAATAGVSILHSGACAKTTTWCKDNGDCATNMYCHLDQGCQVTGAKMGKCAVKPQNCPSTKDPVCGCDGKTHGNSCAANWAGTSVAYKGKCASCAELSQDFSQAVVQAKACNSMWNKISCTLKVKSNLGCPCPTYIEDSNKAAITTMSTAESRWQMQGCKPWPCGMSCGPPPKKATCEGFGAAGKCTDKYK